MAPSHDREDEYAEAFRRGYERARRSAEPTVPLNREGATRRTRDHNPADRAEDLDSEARWDDRESWGLDLFRRHDDIGARPAEPPYAEPPYADRSGAEGQAPVAEEAATRPHTRPDTRLGPDSERSRRRTALALAALVVSALLLVGAAFGLGRLFADSADSADSAAEDNAASARDTDGEPAHDAQPADGGEPGAQRYDGPVDAVAVGGSAASCQSGSSVDSAGNPVTYDPAKAHDSDLSTAWRCPGSGEGQRFTVTLADAGVVAEVGLVPGYAKTDPVSGADRYAENNRLTKVRWVFDDGTSYVQRMSGDPADRSMRTMRIPEISTSNVVIEILGVSPGPRDTVAISEIRLASPSR